ncbi:single myb histone 4 isoform X2 [Hordeum vulgare subsp. vulgare]|uniref:MYB transcription factor n=1 Tax=Hordeum vulgare subsp. vulgare TaxID=112509 RepID=A0A8I6XPX6_HORVV|nr:single myb histone 4 isoform X2 [Hordeum vulgare subsp. vulgare]
MGAPKQKWTSEEEEALRRGVLKHGAGKWRTIQKDPEFSPVLSSRSNIDLKDKWRNLSFSASGLGSRDKQRVPRPKAPSSSPSPSPQLLLLPAPNSVADAAPPEDSEKSPHDDKTPSPKYSAMILEALGELKEPNGSEVTTICNFIEQRHEVQPNFRRLLCAKLRRLIGVNKVEKIDKSYKLTDSYAKRALAPMKDSSLKKKDPAKSSKAAKGLALFAAASPALDAAEAAAMKVADAEAKSHLANEHMMEVERIGKMAEETESLLALAEELYQRCSRGEVLTILQVAKREI